MNDSAPAAPATLAPPATRQDRPGTHPPVTVIMAARGEERRLPAAVSHILDQDYPAPIELVLAIGPSRDRTRELARQLADADTRITVLDNPAGEIPAGLNLAIAASSYPVIIRADARSLLPASYVRTAVQILNETGAANVGGYRAAQGFTWFQQAVAWAMTSPAGVGPARYQTGGEPGPCDSVYLGVFRRDALVQADGYRESYLRAEDWELNLRIRRAGGLIWFHPALGVTYRPREGLRALASQYWHYGRWRHVVAREHAGTINARYLAPPAVTLTVTAGIVAGLAGAATGTAVLAAAGFAVPVLYLAGVASVTATARSLPWRARAWLPAVLITMHLSWGAGYLTSPRGLAGPPLGHQP